MIDLLLVDTASKMLIEAVKITKAVAAQAAPVPRTIPCGGGSNASIAVIVPFDLLVGKDVAWVYLATILIDLLAVDARRAVAGLKVVAYTCEVGEHVGTPRTFDIPSNVDRRFEMLKCRMSMVSIQWTISI